MIYIIHFQPPLAGKAHYYLGWCPDDGLQSRLNEHYTGRGAAITRAAYKLGIGMTLALTLPGDRATERRLKRQKNTPRIVRRLSGSPMPANNCDKSEVR